jgi:hypothetical protein
LHLLKGDSYYDMTKKLSRFCLRALGRCPKPKKPWADFKVDPLESYDFVNDVKELRLQLGQPISRYALKGKDWSPADFGGIKMYSGGYGRYRVPSVIAETTVPRQPKMTMSLELLLTMFRSCMSTDPRDKIFALQNILSQLQNATLIGTLKQTTRPNLKQSIAMSPNLSLHIPGPSRYSLRFKTRVGQVTRTSQVGSLILESALGERCFVDRVGHFSVHRARTILRKSPSRLLEILLRPLVYFLMSSRTWQTWLDAISFEPPNSPRSFQRGTQMDISD